MGVQDDDHGIFKCGGERVFQLVCGQQVTGGGRTAESSPVLEKVSMSLQQSTAPVRPGIQSEPNRPKKQRHLFCVHDWRGKCGTLKSNYFFS